MADNHPTILADGAPSVDRHKGLITITTSSGGVLSTYAVSAHEALHLATELTRAVDNVTTAEVTQLRTA